jgi:hypothetical protein
MPDRLTALKLISITSENAATKKIKEILRQHGIKSVRVSSILMEEFQPSTSMDINESQTQLECLASESLVAPILTDIEKHLLKNYDIGFFVTDAMVLRPEIFT